MKLFALVITLVATSFGQQTIVGSGSAGRWGSGWALSESTSVTNAIATISVAQNCLQLSTGTSCWDQTLENRKLDNKGPSIAEVRQSAAQLKQEELAPVNYISLAKSIGAMTTGDEAEMLQTIFDAELHVYDFAKVDAYLYRQALKQGANYRWVWKPLRKVDVEAMSTFGSYQVYEHVGVIHNQLYGQLIPMRTMTVIEKMLKAMPEMIFMVSDYEVLKPDPFLAISTRRLLAQGKVWIIDQWDEPGFTDGGSVLARR